MATQGGFIDTKGVAAETLAALSKALGVEEGTSIPQNVFDAINKLLEAHFKQYNKSRHDLVVLYERSKKEYTDLKTSMDKQSDDYKKQIENEKRLKDEEIEAAVAFHKKLRDDVTRDADAAQDRIETERDELEKKKKEAKDEIDKYKKRLWRRKRIGRALSRPWRRNKLPSANFRTRSTV